MVLVAAIAHSVWNFAARKVAGNVGVIWLSTWTAGIFLLPFAITVPASMESVVRVLPFVLGTGIIHSIYFLSLAKSYEKGEISFVYPVARGTGVALTAVLAVVIVHEKISWTGGLGVITITAGILLLGLNSSQADGKLATGLYALCVGSTIAGYSIVDKLGVEQIHPVLYLCAIFLLSGLLLSPYVLVRHTQVCLDAASRLKKYILIVGLGSSTSYLIILSCFQIGNVSYIVAVREFGVVIGSALGFVFLKEELTPRKGLGIVGITLGTMIVKFGG